MSAPRSYMPEPVIEASFDIKYASDELVALLNQHAREGVATWGALLSALGLTLDSPVLLAGSTIYTMPDRTDISFRLRTRKEF